MLIFLWRITPRVQILEKEAISSVLWCHPKIIQSSTWLCLASHILSWYTHTSYRNRSERMTNPEKWPIFIQFRKSEVVFLETPARQRWREESRSYRRDEWVWENAREAFRINITEVKDHCSPCQAKTWRRWTIGSGQQSAVSQGRWGVRRRGVPDLCLSISWSFDLKAGKDTARNKCLGHDILSMLGHRILAVWWQMTEQRAWSRLWSNSIRMKLWASAPEHSRKELKWTQLPRFLLPLWWMTSRDAGLASLEGALSRFVFCCLLSVEEASSLSFRFLSAWNHS